LTLVGEEAARRLGDHRARGYLFLEAAESHRESREMDSAATCYEEAAHSLELAKDHQRVASALIRLGAMWWEVGESPAACDAFERALPWLQRVHDIRAQASVLAVLGDIANQEDAEEAIDYYTEALRLLESQDGATQQVACIHYALGRAYSQRGRNADAADEYAKALEAFTAAGDVEGRVQAYRALGQAYLRLDDRERAVQVLERAAQLEERQTLGVDAALNLGRAYMREKRWQEALEHQRRALSRAILANDRRNMALAYNSLGNALLESGDRRQAIKAYEEAVAIWQELGDDVGLAKTYNNLAVAYRRAGRWDQARRLLDKAAYFLEKRDDKDTLASVYNNIGLILAAQRKQREAVKFYERSLALKDELGDLYGANITKLNLQALSRRD